MLAVEGLMGNGLVEGGGKVVTVGVGGGVGDGLDLRSNLCSLLAKRRRKEDESYLPS